MKLQFAIFSIVMLSLLVPQSVRAGDLPQAEDLSRLVATALAQNSEVKGSEARWQVFRNKITQARSFEDPMLMLKIQNGIFTDPFNFRKDPMTQKVIGISQQLPFWGKRDLKGEVAAKEAESYKWQVEERKLELRRMVAETYYQIYFTDKSLAIVDKNLKILDDFVTITETKYSVGQGAQQDLPAPRRLLDAVQRRKVLRHGALPGHFTGDEEIALQLFQALARAT